MEEVYREDVVLNDNDLREFSSVQDDREIRGQNRGYIGKVNGMGTLFFLTEKLLIYFNINLSFNN